MATKAAKEKPESAQAPFRLDDFVNSQLIVIFSAVQSLQLSQMVWRPRQLELLNVISKAALRITEQSKPPRNRKLREF